MHQPWKPWTMHFDSVPAPSLDLCGMSPTEIGGRAGACRLPCVPPSREGHRRVPPPTPYGLCCRGTRGSGDNEQKEQLLASALERAVRAEGRWRPLSQQRLHVRQGPLVPWAPSPPAANKRLRGSWRSGRRPDFLQQKKLLGTAVMKARIESLTREVRGRVSKKRGESFY